MFRPLFILFFILTVFLVIARDPIPQVKALMPRYLAAEQLFQEAERIAEKGDDDPAAEKRSDQLYLKALELFKGLMKPAANAKNDSLLFLVCLRAGYIEFVFDSSDAKKDLLAAIQVKEKNPHIPDSLLFAPLVFAGGLYYAGNDFDSALLLFNKAEVLAGKLRSRPKEIQRLYNRLGVLYYETGNYRQAKVYFEMAISLTPSTETSLLINYRMNIASLLVKLDELEQARIMYESLLPTHVFTNEIYHNLGIIQLRQGKPEQAILTLRKVNYSNDRKLIDLCYNKAMAMAALGESDSAAHYQLLARAEVSKWYGSRKNASLGLLYKFEGDEWMRKNEPDKALQAYQQAILQFAPDFNDVAVESDPDGFETVHSYINLFNTMIAKADAFRMSVQFKNLEKLQLALSAYKAAFKLAEHVEQTYNSDEARLFLQKIKYEAHNRPIETGLYLYKLTRKKEYLESVYQFDQQNKASVLTLNRWEKKLRSSNPALNALYEQEESLKSLITRTTIRAGQSLDSSSLAYLTTLIHDKEIELNNIQELIKKRAGLNGQLAQRKVPTVQELQADLDNQTAILSYHLSPEALLILLIEGNKFEYRYVPIDSNFTTAAGQFQTELNRVEDGSRYNGHELARELFKKLIRPFNAELSQIKRLIIIPDDELNYLPFEALEDDHGNYLVQLFSIQYQFASSVIGAEKRSGGSGRIISFAPFASRSFADSAGNLSAALPWSAKETNETGATLYTDSLATKSYFLSKAIHYPVIHLATHASANNTDPMLSSIAFYPGEKDHLLTTREIYDLNLDSTQLIVLSACETAEGKLEKGEGLLSLSRAFAYAGCPNIIASLWKAEDRTTAYLSQRLYYYLSRDYKKDEALQMAKVDLLNNKEIEGRSKSPRYWAHLVLIGEYEPHHHRKNWAGVAFGIVAMLLGYVGIRKWKARLRSSQAG